MKVENCPACGSGAPVSISSYNQPIVSILNGITFTQPPYSIHVCKHCGIHYKDHILSQEEFIRYYENVDFGKWNINEFFPPEKIILDYLFLKKEKLDVLDFGCSEGRLLAELVPRHQCFGFDYNKDSLEVARKKGVQIVFDMAEFDRQERKFDIILMIDVFEHLLNPDETIRRLAGLLKEKGQLIISTGYAGSAAYLKRPAEFWYFLNLEHVCMLSDQYIKHICEGCHLKISFRKYTSHYKFKTSLRLKMKFDQLLYWNTYRWRKFGFLHRVYPFNRIFRTENYPYYPATRDHIVLALEKKAAV